MICPLIIIKKIISVVRVIFLWMGTYAFFLRSVGSKRHLNYGLILCVDSFYSNRDKKSEKEDLRNELFNWANEWFEVFTVQNVFWKFILTNMFNCATQDIGQLSREILENVDFRQMLVLISYHEIIIGENKISQIRDFNSACCEI